MNVEVLQNKKKLSLKNYIRRFFARDFFQSPLVQWILIGAVAVDLANWGSLAFFIRSTDFPIILHYNVYFGVDIIGSWWQVYFLPAMGTVVLAINAGLAYIFYQQKERIAAHLLLLAAFLIQAGISIAAASVILINY